MVQRDPFAMVGIDATAIRRDWSGGVAATEEQVAWLRKAGVPVATIRGLSGRQAFELQERLLARRSAGMCTFKQALQLADFGIDPRNEYFDHASELLTVIRRGKGRSLEDLRDECRGLGARFFDAEEGDRNREAWA